VPRVCRLVQTRLPCGCPTLGWVNQATRMHSPDHSTKGTPSALGSTQLQWPLTAGEYVVSGTISSPLRGAFHLSLTVLVRYRSLKVFSLGGWSPQLPTRFHVPRGTQDANPVSHACPLRDSHPLWWRIPTPLSTARDTLRLVLQPRSILSIARFGLFPVRSPLLRESRLISLRWATEMFQFTHGPPPCL
jgi:hypothetical protein